MCVLVDFIHESFAPLLPVQRSGKIHNQRVVEDWYFIIDKDNVISFPNILRTVQYSRILHYIFVIMKISRNDQIVIEEKSEYVVLFYSRLTVI